MSKHESKTELRSGAERYLAFTLGAEQYAVPLLSVKEVVALPETTRVPYTPPHFLGIMNLRGQVISLFDLRLKLGMKADNGPESAVIICDLNPLSFGVVVNSVDSVLSLFKDDIKSKPETESKIKTDYIQGVTQRQGKLVLLLDVAKALSIDEILAIKRNAAANLAS